MAENDSWQDAAACELVALLRPDPQVLALALAGSLARGASATDVWSDVDALVVLEEGALARYFPTTEWLRTLGELFAYEQNSNALTRTTRVCFEDFRRLDIVLTTEAALERIDSWGFVSFWQGTRTLFSRSEVADRALAREFASPRPQPVSREQFQAIANQFWFKAAQAVVKVARKDLLIALHLALDLARDCCLLGMLLRDRAEGTTHHRHGGAGNELAARLSVPLPPVNADSILDAVGRSAAEFDELAARLSSEWAPDYAPRRAPLLAAIGRARRAASGS